MWDAAAAVPGSSASGPGQQRLVDAIKAGVRDDTPGDPLPIFKTVPPHPEPSDDPLDQRIGEEIEDIRRHLDLLGSALANDPVLIMRHGAELQSIDLINQLLGHLGAVIGAEDKTMAVERICLTELRARLKRRPLTIPQTPSP